MIDSRLNEHRKFPPPAAFRAKAHISSEADYQRLWQASCDDPEKFWAHQAREFLQWDKAFTKVLNWQAPHVKWFEDGTLNVAVNCVDRHAKGVRRDKPALIWEGEPGDKRVLSYADLQKEVSKCANMLSGLGLRAGDCVAIYLPMIPEMMIAMLACARLGVMHCVVFGGFSAESLADRCNDAKVKVIVTADGGWRRGVGIELKKNVDEAVLTTPTVTSVVVVQRTKQTVDMRAKRDHWWQELMAEASVTHAPKAFPAEQPLFLLYTSGSTGKPKGILHTSAGYLLGAAVSYKYVFDHHEDDVFWCTADAGWITGHSYLVYGPLANGSTVVMYEGAPQTPDMGRFWKIIETYKVTTFYTAPTAIRTFMRSGDEWPKRYDLSSLKLLGSVGEPINPEAWMWYRDTIGGGQCPIVDTWWQTETGGIMIASLPGAVDGVPGSAGRPMFGVVPEIVDKSGNPVEVGKGGFLILKQPFPSLTRGIYGDDARFAEQYFSQVPGQYFTGDGARQDKDGNFWILGRIDDVLNVSGHRLSTMEIESALVSHPMVAEAAVVGVPHEVKGEGIFCFVTLKNGVEENEQIKKALCDHVAKHIGGLARPDTVKFAAALPKTRSGKIMRRLLRDVAAGRESRADMSTLEDVAVLARLQEED